MNEQQAKALFFAQYLGQKVFKYSACEWTEILEFTHFEPTLGEVIGQLLLRTVNQLTDEEAIQCCRILMGERKIYSVNKTNKHIDVEVNYNEASHHIFRIYFDEFSFACVTLDYKGQNFLQASRESFYVQDKDLYSVGQFMLRIGILLPFTYIDETGKPVTLSVEEIIQKGWAKCH